MKKILYTAILTALTSTAWANGAHHIDPSAPIPALTTLASAHAHGAVLPTFATFSHRGVDTALYTDTRLPIVYVSLYFARPYDEPLAAAVLGRAMMRTGGQSLSEDGYYETLEGLGAGISISGGGDYASIHISALRQNLDEVMALVYDMLKSPRQDPKVFAQKRANLIQSLKTRPEDAGELADIMINQMTARHHPYGQELTADDIGATTQDDIARYQQKTFTLTGAKAVFSGDIDEAHAKQILDALPLDKGAPKKGTPVPAPIIAHWHLPTDHPQTQVVMSLPMPIIHDEQKQAHFELASKIIAGGDFEARLMREVRDKKGYTYGISGSGSQGKLGASYEVNFATDRATLDDALALTISLLKGEPISEHEFLRAKTNFTQSMMMGLTSISDIHSAIKSVHLEGHDGGALARLPAVIEGATLDGVQKSSELLRAPVSIATVGGAMPAGAVLPPDDVLAMLGFKRVNDHTIEPKE